jgi:hypothetical protein
MSDPQGSRHRGPPPADDPRRCTAHKKDGERCSGWALKGLSVCGKHGGANPAARRAGLQRHHRQTQIRRAERAVAVLGLARDIEPHAALLEEVHRTAGHVSALELIVAGLQHDRIMAGTTKMVETPSGQQATVEAALNPWVALYQSERDRLVNVCRVAISCGVEQRRVQIEEEHGRLIADVFRQVFHDQALGLDDAQRTRAMTVTARHLRLIAAG